MAASDDPRLFARVGKMSSKPSKQVVHNPVTGDSVEVVSSGSADDGSASSTDPIFGQPVRPKTPRSKSKPADAIDPVTAPPAGLVSPRARRASADTGSYDPFGTEKPAAAKRVGKTDPSKFLFDPNTAATGTNIVTGLPEAEHKAASLPSRPAQPDPAILSPRREMLSPRTRGAYNPVTNQDDPTPSLPRTSSKGAFNQTIDKNANGDPINFSDSSAPRPKKVAKGNPESFLYESGVSAGAVIFGSGAPADAAPAPAAAAAAAAAPAAPAEPAVLSPRHAPRNFDIITSADKPASAVPRSSSKGAFNQTIDKDATGSSPITFTPTTAAAAASSAGPKRVAKANPENFLYNSDGTGFNIVTGQTNAAS